MVGLAGLVHMCPLSTHANRTRFCLVANPLVTLSSNVIFISLYSATISDKSNYRTLTSNDNVRIHPSLKILFCKNPICTKYSSTLYTFTVIHFIGVRNRTTTNLRLDKE